MSKSMRPEVQKVIDRAAALEIPLKNHIEMITKTYIDGGVQGFRFRPKDYDGLQEAIADAIRRMVLFDDDFTDSIGSIMGSDARKHGFTVSARENNLHNSLHIELARSVCDVHIDSNSITTGHVGFPFYGGHYDPTRLIAHGVQDLAPSMLANSKAAALAPYLNPILSRLDLQLSLNARAPETGQREVGFLTGAGAGPAKEAFRVGFSLTFKFD